MVKFIPSFTEIFLNNDVRVLVVIYGGLNMDGGYGHLERIRYYSNLLLINSFPKTPYY